MGKPTPRERIEHVLEAKRLVKGFVAEMNEASFLNDIKIQSVVPVFNHWRSYQAYS